MKYLLAALTLVSIEAQGTALSDLAGQMKAGDWRALATNNILPVFTGTGGSCNMINPYSDAMKWDPVGHKAYFLGSDHGGTPGQNYRFVCYNESTNAWIRLPDPPWHTDVPYNDAHGYDKTAINPAARILYRNPYNSTTVRTYDIATGAWSALPDGPGGAACCDAIDYFPDLNGLVRIAGSSSAVLYNTSTQQWSTLGSVASLASTWTFAEYNPVHRVMLLGSSTNALFKVNSSGQVSALKTMGVSVYDGSAWTGAVTVDPVSGDYLVFTPTDRAMHVYDVATDAWKTPDHPPPAGSLSGGALDVAPVSNYGVNLFVHCKSGCQVIVYKHSAGSAAERAAFPASLQAITVSPNPFRGFARIRGPEGLLALYDLHGKKALSADMSGELVLSAGNLAPGIYIARISHGNRTTEARLVILK